MEEVLLRKEIEEETNKIEKLMFNEKSLKEELSTLYE